MYNKSLNFPYKQLCQCCQLYWFLLQLEQEERIATFSWIDVTTLSSIHFFLMASRDNIIGYKLGTNRLDDRKKQVVSQ